MLERIASLPRTTGSRIAFEADHYPSPQVIVATTTINGQPTALSSSVPLSTFATTGTGTGTGSSVPVETSPSSPGLSPQPASSGLSTTAKAGIGAGVALAGLAALAALLFFFIKWRREAKANNSTPASDFASPGHGHDGPGLKHASVFDPHAPHHGLDNGGEKHPPGFDPRYGANVVPSPATPAVSELSATAAARPWSMRSELHGSSEHTAPASPETYRAYRPESSLVPASLVPGGNHAPPQNVNRNGALTPVAELP